MGHVRPENEVSSLTLDSLSGFLKKIWLQNHFIAFSEANLLSGK